MAMRSMGIQRGWSDVRAVVRARRHLLHAARVGSRVRLTGRPRVVTRGQLIVHDRVQLISTVATLELVAEAAQRSRSVLDPS